MAQIIEFPVVERLRGGARKVALVTSVYPGYEGLSDDVIVRMACKLADTPDCFVPNGEAREAILAEYREAEEVFAWATS